MVNGLRSWLRSATTLLHSAESLFATPIGEAVFFEGGWDSHLEEEAIIWLNFKKAV